MFKLTILALTLPLVNSQFTCDIVDDDTNSCIGVYNGICENDLFSCRNSDCWDCDPCRAYNFDCSGCVSAGCSWCATDLFCSSGPITHQSIYNPFGLPSCGTTGWSTSIDVCQASDFEVFNDPMYPANEWAYTLMNVQPVWADGLTGAGVRVRINDDGFARDHPEFVGRFDEAGSCSVYWDPPNDGERQSTHGTAVASILGAAADNGEGAMGIAPGVTFSACIFDFTEPFLGIKVDSMDISVNSWGVDACFANSRRKRRSRKLQGCPFIGAFISPCSVSDCSGSSFAMSQITSTCLAYIAAYCDSYYEDDIEACDEYVSTYVDCDYTDPIDNFRAQEQGLFNGIKEGRNGLGVIYVFASGNEFTVGEDVNAELHLNSRYTISVAAVGKDGLHASYSSAGAPVLISAPGGDSESFTNWIAAKPPLYGGGYYDATIGTSFACPALAGAVALMLQANPNLTWNDVQGILATTAKEVTDDPDVTFTTNAAGLHHANEYGFGIVDAAAAVAAAKNWTSYGPEYRTVRRTVVGSSIVDSESSSLTSTVDVVDDGSEFFVHSVVVQLELDHFSRGDLEIVLTSPGGTESVMHPGRRAENTNDVEEAWELMTVRNWGESVVGTWTLTITDLSPGALESCADNEFSIYEGNSQITCEIVALNDACINGSPRASFRAALREEDEHGNTAMSSCCLCGGGSTSATNVLEAWTLRAYGNILGTLPPQVPTPAPSFPPQFAPNAPTSGAGHLLTFTSVWKALLAVAAVIGWGM